MKGIKILAFIVIGFIILTALLESFSDTYWRGLDWAFRFERDWIFQLATITGVLGLISFIGLVFAIVIRSIKDK